MTAPAVTCGRCHTSRVYKRIQTSLLGALPVELGLCDCDYLRCPHKGCKKVIRSVAVGVHRCPHCDGRL